MFKIGTKGGYGISERGGPGNCQLLERVAFARTCATFFPLFMKFRGLTPPPKKGGGGIMFVLLLIFAGFCVIKSF